MCPRIVVCVLLAGILTVSGDALARPTGEAISIGRSITVKSEILGEDREILIHKPAGYDDGSARYPVLYLTDAEFAFHFATGIVDFLSKTGRIPQMLVVGIVNVDRVRDLTPPPGEKEGERFPSSGRAGNFVRFVEQELTTWVDAHNRTQPYRILAGHSYGGLFAIHALLTGSAFDAVIASSPSLYWNDESQASWLERDGSRTRLSGRTLFFSIGEEREEMVKAAETFAARLESSPPEEFDWRFVSMENRDHEEMSFAGLYDGLEFIHRDLRDPSPIGEIGFAAWRDRTVKKYGYEIALPRGFLFEATPLAQRRSCRDMLALMTYWHEQDPGFFERFMDDWVEEGESRLDEDPACAVDLFELLGE